MSLYVVGLGGSSFQLRVEILPTSSLSEVGGLGSPRRNQRLVECVRDGKRPVGQSFNHPDPIFFGTVHPIVSR